MTALKIGELQVEFTAKPGSTYEGTMQLLTFAEIGGVELARICSSTDPNKGAALKYDVGTDLHFELTGEARFLDGLHKFAAMFVVGRDKFELKLPSITVATTSVGQVKLAGRFGYEYGLYTVSLTAKFVVPITVRGIRVKPFVSATLDTKFTVDGPINEPPPSALANAFADTMPLGDVTLQWGQNTISTDDNKWFTFADSFGAVCSALLTTVARGDYYSSLAVGGLKAGSFAGNRNNAFRGVVPFNWLALGASPGKTLPAAGSVLLGEDAAVVLHWGVGTSTGVRWALSVSAFTPSTGALRINRDDTINGKVRFHYVGIGGAAAIVGMRPRIAGCTSSFASRTAAEMSARPRSAQRRPGRITRASAAPSAARHSRIARSMSSAMTSC